MDLQGKQLTIATAAVVLAFLVLIVLVANLAIRKDNKRK